MKRHRSDVVFHHENNQQTNQTLPATRIDDRDDDLHLFLKLSSMKAYGKKKTKVTSTEDDNHVHKHRELSYGDKESSFITLGQRPETVQHYEKYKKPKPESSNELMDTILNKLELMGDRGHDILKRLNEKLKLTQTTDYVQSPQTTETIQDVEKDTTSTPTSDDNEETEKIRQKREAAAVKSQMKEWLNNDDRENDAAIEKVRFGIYPGYHSFFYIISSSICLHFAFF